MLWGNQLHLSHAQSTLFWSLSFLLPVGALKATNSTVPPGTGKILLQLEHKEQIVLTTAAAVRGIYYSRVVKDLTLRMKQNGMFPL